jgi:hypothetical protein
MKDSTVSPAATAAKPGFRLGRVLLIVVPLVAIVLGGFYFFTYGDGMSWLRDRFSPSLVPVTGRVLVGDKPLAHGQVSTQIIDSNLKGSMAFTDNDGKFTLQVEIEGNRVDGAYPGEHIVTVKGADYASPHIGAGAPVSATPAEYGSFKDSPLRIVVDSSKEAKNHFELKVPKPPSTPSGRPPATATAPPAQNARPTAEGWVQRTLDQLDKDQNGELSTEERQAAEGSLAGTLSGADANKDGKLDNAELLSVASQVMRLSPGEAPANDRPESESEPEPEGEAEAEAGPEPEADPSESSAESSE